MAEDRMTLRLPPEVRRQIEDRAAADGVKPGAWARRALEAALGSSSSEAGESSRPDDAASPASPRAPESETQKNPWERIDDLRVDLENRAAAHPKPGRGGLRHCSRCKKSIPPPSLTIHPGCGGRVVPEPE